jgi:ureidoglycolate hydrolase
MSERHLKPETATAEAIAPYGTLIEPSADGTPFGPGDARLELGAGTPRLYIMRLPARPMLARGITRHALVTQCLAALGGREWFICLAPPDASRETPDFAAIRCFRIGGGVALALQRGAWHAGPYFEAETQDFLNLELTDTNETDHHTATLPTPIRIAP